MIRFILTHRFRDSVSGFETSGFETLDLDVPDLEARLKRGGFGENGYDRTELINVEILEEKAAQEIEEGIK